MGLVFCIGAAFAQKPLPSGIDADKIINTFGFNEACQHGLKGNLVELKKAIATDPTLVTSVDPKSQARVSECAVVGHQLEIITYLVEEMKFDVNSVNAVGLSLIHYAAISNADKIMAYLISKGANVNIRDRSGQAALHLAAGLGNSEVVKILIQAKADISPKDNRGRTPADNIKIILEAAGNEDKSIKARIQASYDQMLGIFYSKSFDQACTEMQKILFLISESPKT